MKNVTFYTHNIDPSIPEMQKKVFEKFGLEIIQIKSDDWKGHAGEIDTFLKENFNGGTICIWDIDCIPLNREVVERSHRHADNGHIFSVAQKASHIPNSIVYCSPAFICFSYRTWQNMGEISFQATERSDCGGELTHKAKELRIQYVLLYPTQVEKPLWQLTDTQMFGKGTTYGDAIYHAFLSRKGNAEMFINKCNEILCNA